MTSSRRRITITVDEDLYRALEAYSVASDAGNLSATARRLLAERLASKLARAVVPEVRDAVSDELRDFVARIEERMAFVGDDVLDSLDDRVSTAIAANARVSAATLAVVSGMAAETDPRGRTASEIRQDAMDDAWSRALAAVGGASEGL